VTPTWLADADAGFVGKMSAILPMRKGSAL
jgi:hypothetical protein